MLKLILVNNEPKSTKADTLQQFAEELELPGRGVAVAINNRVIPRGQWSETFLTENDSITVIKAAFGG